MHEAQPVVCLDQIRPRKKPRPFSVADNDGGGNLAGVSSHADSTKSAPKTPKLSYSSAMPHFGDTSYTKEAESLILSSVLLFIGVNEGQVGENIARV
jgi:hypothetical protein